MFSRFDPLTKENIYFGTTFEAKIPKENTYRVTHQVRQNLLLTSKHKFRFGLASPGYARPKQNLCFDVNRRF